MCTLQVNKFPHAHFTTKIGIHQSLQQLHWFTNFSMNSFFPRCYQVPLHTTYQVPASSSSPSYSNCNCQVFLEEERKSFIDDYRLTACMNVLKWFVTNLSEQVIIIIIVDSVIKSKCDQQLIKKTRVCKQLNHIKQLIKKIKVFKQSNHIKQIICCKCDQQLIRVFKQLREKLAGSEEL